MPNSSTDSTIDTPVRLAAGFDSLDRARGYLLMLIEPLSEEEMFTRANPGSNHAMWVVGHLATTDDYFLRAFAGQETVLPADWDARFGGGSTPSDDRAAHPSKAEMIAIAEERRGAIKDWLRTLDEQTLTKPIEGDMSMFLANLAGLPSSIAMHDGIHAGQITCARRALGHTPGF